MAKAVAPNSVSARIGASARPAGKKRASTDAAVAGGKKASSKATTLSSKRKPTPSQIVVHAYGTIIGELQKLEQQTGVQSQDRERASRALSQIMSSLDKAIDMQRKLAKAARRGATKANSEALAHAETLRREIADRIERLGRAGAAARNSE